jgi:predicted CopG family antitoxin
MATKTITIKESAYRALARCKEGNESFSDVIEREFSGKIDTAADLLELSRSLRKSGRRFGFVQRRKGKIRAA